MQKSHQTTLPALLGDKGVTGPCRGSCHAGALYPPLTHMRGCRHRKPLRSTQPKPLHRLVWISSPRINLPSKLAFLVASATYLTCLQLSFSTCALLKVSWLSPLLHPDNFCQFLESLTVERCGLIGHWKDRKTQLIKRNWEFQLKKTVLETLGIS